MLGSEDVTRRRAMLLGLLTFAALVWLSPQTAANWQVVSRLGMTASIVEHGKLNIDRFAGQTGDRAEHDGHLYSDKPPGHPLLAVVPIAITHAILVAAGKPAAADDDRVLRIYNGVGVISVNVVISAVATAFLYLAALKLGASQGGALFAAIAFAFATPFLGWSTAFFGHSVSASLLAILLWVAASAWASRGGRTGGPTFLHSVLIGLLCGGTVCVDFTAAPAAALLALVPILAEARRGGPSAALLRTTGIGIGGLIGVSPVFLVNMLEFGTPFRLGYSYSTFGGMQSGFFGIALPRANVLFRILFGLYRGLLPLSPILVLAPLGVARMLRAGVTRPIALVVIGASLAFLWINAGYVHWHGGWSTGPRHLVPMLPFLSLSLAFAWGRPLHLPAMLLLGISAFISLVCASVDMFAPQRIAAPFFHYLLPAFLQWKHLPDLVVVGTIWVVLGWMLLRATHAADGDARSQRTASSYGPSSAAE